MHQIGLGSSRQPQLCTYSTLTRECSASDENMSEPDGVRYIGVEAHSNSWRMKESQKGSNIERVPGIPLAASVAIMYDVLSLKLHRGRQTNFAYHYYMDAHETIRQVRATALR